MDDQVDGEDGYSDDDLDTLPDHTFRELQQNALTSTQQPSKREAAQLPHFTSPQRPLSNFVGGIGRLSLGREVPRQDEPHKPSSDYGDFDDEMLDGEIFDAAEQPALAAHFGTTNRVGTLVGEITQREQWRRQRYSASPSRLEHQRAEQLEQIDGPMVNGLALGQNKIRDSGYNSHIENSNAHAQPAQATSDVEALQAQVHKLLCERETLQQSIQNANDIAFSKAGEIAIVRANASKIEKDFENRTRTLQKLHTDEAARQKIEVEKARSELQKIATEKDFLENDLAEGTKQIRNLQKAIKKGGDKSPGTKLADMTNQVTPPKRNKSMHCGDGFDDEEIQPCSPSKLVLRSKANTPKAGVKRKRKATGVSPAKTLDLDEAIQAESFEETVPEQRKTNPVLVAQAPRRQDRSFQFTQKLLNHRIERGGTRCFEALADFRFPSQPEKALSTILLDEMAKLSARPDVEHLPPAIGLILISLWSRCMKEKYHAPTHLFIELIKHILITTPLKAAPDLTNSLMNLVQETADILIIPRFKKEPPSPTRALISSTECLLVIHLMAQDLSLDVHEITRFWRTMRFDFVMMLLSFIHPLAELHLTISLLHTSALKTSFAMIVPPNDGKQDPSEARVIDNLSRLLVEAPRPAMGEPPLDAVELSTLRLRVLELMETMCESIHGAHILAKHRLVIGRLIRVMDDELDRVYDYQYGHELRIALVNDATRLLFHLTHNYPQLINMQARLSVIPGGEKKFLIALTRLAFSEGGFFEGGIEDDVVDCAHQMLEARVSPEEAEQLVEAFSSAPSVKGSKELA